jgi:hypothetical protein
VSQGPLRLAPWLQSLTIKDKDNRLSAFDVAHSYTDEHGCLVDFGWAQREMIAEVERQYNADKPVRIIVLKARQLGISTLTEGTLFLWNFFHPGSGQLVIAHDTKSTRSLFEKTKLYWKTWPGRRAYKLTSDTQHRLLWEHLSSMEVATARNVASARGMTIHGVHASEVAFWDDPETLFTGLNQTIPNRKGTIIVMESTANGTGDYFHTQWKRAEVGGSDYAPLFFPWWKHYEYTARHAMLDPNCDYLDADERWLRDNLGLDDDRLAWRRWAIENLFNGDPEMFKQEYPATPSEAFLATGTNVFPLEKLKECHKPERGMVGFIDTHSGNFVPQSHGDGKGTLTVYRKPHPEQDYFVAGDPTYSTQNDRACIQVINRRTYEQVAVWHGYVDPIQFGYEIMKLGKYFNDAMISTEVNGPGFGTIGVIMALNYPNVWRHRQADRVPGALSPAHGWFANWNRKEQQVGYLKHLVLLGRDGPLASGIHDPVTFEQMRDYVAKNTGVGFTNADPNGYDDAVSALSQAYICSNYEGPLPYVPEHADVPDLRPRISAPIMASDWEDPYADLAG